MVRRTTDIRRRIAWAATLCAVFVSGCSSLTDWKCPRIDPSGRQLFLCDNNNKNKAPTTPGPATAPSVPGATAAPPAAAAAPPKFHEEPGGPLPWEPVDLLLTPKDTVAPVGSEVILLAGVRGKDNYLRTNERVEWTLAAGSVGEFVDFAKGSYCDLMLCDFNWPRKKSSTMVIGSTLRDSIRLTRGTPTPDDDVNVVSGQTWVSVSSSSEGTSYVTALAPDVYGWDRRKHTAAIHWVDANWRLPAPGITPAGSRHLLTTTVTRHADAAPRAGWRVVYTVQGGPSAGFGPNGAPSIEVETDVSGRATAELTQATATQGTNTILVQIVRPASGANGPVPIGGGTTTVMWSAAGIALRKTGPATAAVGASLTYHLELRNPGALPTDELTLSDEIPEGMTYLGSTPPGTVVGRTVQWAAGRLGPGECRYVEIQYRAERTGTLAGCANAASAGGLNARDCATTVVGTEPAFSGTAPPAGSTPPNVLPGTTPGGGAPPPPSLGTMPAASNAVGERPVLQLTVSEPGEVAVGEEATFTITIANTGRVDATNIAIRDHRDPGLYHPATPDDLVNQLSAPLPPGRQVSQPISFKVTKPGRLCHTVTVTSAEGVTATKIACVTGVERKTPASGIGAGTTNTTVDGRGEIVRMEVKGPPAIREGEEASISIDLYNDGLRAIPKAQLRITLDPSLIPLDDGTTPGLMQDRTGNNDLFWTVGSLPSRAPLRHVLRCRGAKASSTATGRSIVRLLDANSATIVDKQLHITPSNDGETASGGSLDIQIAQLTDPVSVNGKIVYRITVTNKGPGAEDRVKLTAFLPPEVVPDPMYIHADREQIRPRYNGNTIQFDECVRLFADKSISYSIAAKAKSAGQAKFTAEVVSQSMTQPKRIEKTTQIIP